MTTRRQGRNGRRIIVGVGIGTVAVGLLIVLTVPRSERDATVAFRPSTEAPVKVRILIDDIDGARGTMKVRVSATPGDLPVPPEGVSVVLDVEDVRPLRVVPDAIQAAEVDAEIPFDRGNISAYPFDRYEGGLLIVGLKGEPVTATEQVEADTVPLAVTIVDTSSGFDVRALGDDATEPDGFSELEIALVAERRFPVVLWASVMMGIYWLLTGAAVAVVLATVLRAREWETRHLAWLAASIFAFASFRAAAPATPPIGVYFDFASFFWAELIVALSLAGLVVFYLVAVRDGASD